MNARSISRFAGDWRPTISRAHHKPIYLAICDALAADIETGGLSAGDKLPTHRALADALGVDLTTITRAYREAQHRGLIEGRVGRGTFVRIQSETAPGARPDTGPTLDRSMNLPPQPPEADIPGHLARGLTALQRGGDLPRLLTYRYGAGSPDDRAAGAAWLRPLLPGATADNVLVCSGAQAALVALLTMLVRPGDVVLAEDLAYPGFRAAASHLGIQVKGVAMDAEGVRPDSLRAACREHKPKALYCVPTIHNPTTATMSLKRRRAIAAIARQHKVLIFEDDAYGVLPPAALPPLATFAPELTFYVASLAKCLTPGLRVAYLHAPDPVYATQLGAAIRATNLMTSPLAAALVTGLIHNGAAAAIVAAIRQESALRQRLAAKILPVKSFRAHPQGHHLWLEVPTGWSRSELVAYARENGLAAVPSDPFVTAPTAGSGVRVALGAAQDRRALEEELRLLAAALAQSPAVLSRVV